MKKRICKFFCAALACALLFSVCPLAAPVFAEEVLTQVETWNVALADEMLTSFYVRISEEPGDGVLNVKDGYGVAEYSVEQIEKTPEGLYRITARTAATQMTDPITLQFASASQTGEQHSYTVAQYARTRLQEMIGAEETELLTAMLNYGAAAQEYFHYQTDDLANAGYESAQTPEIPQAQGGSLTEGSVSGVAFYGASVCFQSRVYTRFYFQATAPIGDYTFTLSDGTQCQPEMKNGLYYIDTPGLNPQNYDKTVTVQVSNGTDTMTVRYDPLTYIFRMYARTEDPTLRNVLGQLYRYHLAAKAYLSSTGTVSGTSGILTDTLTLQGSNFRATVQKGTVLADGAETLSVTVSPTEAPSAEIVIEEKERMEGLYIGLNGISPENTVPVLVQVAQYRYLNQGNIRLYWVESGAYEEMTRVDSVEKLTGGKCYYYDVLSGNVTVAMPVSGEIAIVTNGQNPWNGGCDTGWYTPGQTQYAIANADQLAALGQIVCGKAEGVDPFDFAGTTVSLLATIDLRHSNTEDFPYPIGLFYDVDETALIGAEGVAAFRGTLLPDDYSIRRD